jgi:Fe-S cluster assembly scaffold protein SufB
MAGAVSVPQYEAWFSPRDVDELSSALRDPPAIADRRREAFGGFRDLPIEPNPLYRKYAYFAGVDLAGVRPLARGAAVSAPPTDASTIRVLHDASGTRTFLHEDLREAGVRVDTLADLWAGDGANAEEFIRDIEAPTDRLSALGLMLLNRGVRLTVPDGCPVPIRVQEITVLSQPREAISARRQVRLGTRTRLLWSEEVYATPESPGGQRVYASSGDLNLGAEAQAAYLTVHAPDRETVSVYGRRARLGDRARLSWFWAGLGGFRTRAKNRSELVGSGSDLEDFQTFYGDRDQAYDSEVTVQHVGTDTHGQSITRGVFKDRARGMSRGLVRIERDARKTLSFLSEHAMLLSRGARSDTIPILEILNRDVKATHSSSVAPVDPEKVFYLESRGIEEQAAIRYIAEGFLSYVLERVPVANLRDLLYPMLTLRWDGDTPAWREGAFPALPGLTYARPDLGEEWRFDTKLR